MRGLRSGIRALGAALLGAMVLAAPAGGASIVYIKGGNVWLAAPDGSDQRQVTTGGYWGDPSQADDGTILAARATELYRMSRQGASLAAPIATIFTGAPPQWSGPVGAVISPDGVNQAYGGMVTDSGVWDPSCPCWRYTDTFTTLWGSATAFAQPGQTLGQEDYVDPAWIDSGHLLLTAAGILIDQVATYALGGADNSEVQWFSDPDPSVQSLNDPAITRDQRLLAFVANVGGGLGNEIRIYTASSAPPVPGGPAASAPVDTCNIGPNPSESLRVSFSPDGSSLVYDAGDGIHEVSLAGLPSCAGLDDHLIIPGGSLPYFGPADVGPHDGIQPGGGGGSPTGGGPGGGGGGPGGGGTGGGGTGGGSRSGVTLTGLHASGRGAITLAVKLPGAGRLSATATAPAGGARAHAAHRRRHAATFTYGTVSVAVTRPGTVRLTISPDAAARRRLAGGHALTVTVTVTFRPNRGAAQRTRRSITVRGRRR